MTETLTERIDTTITDLEGMIRAAESRREMEEVEYRRKRDKMVKVAHELGSENSIGEALDDLLEEFDLPRRPWRGLGLFVVQIDYPVQEIPDGGRIRVATGGSLYYQPGMRALYPLAASATAFLPEGSTCLCDDPTEMVRTWVQGYIGSSATPTTNFRYTHVSCQHDDCPNRVVPGYRAANRLRHDEIAALDWNNIPFHPAASPTA